MRGFRKIKLPASSFTRNRTYNMDYLAWRESLLDHYLENYDYFESYGDWEGEYALVNTYGKKGYLIKYIDEGLENANFAMTVIDKFTPKAVLLGGLNMHDIDQYTEGDERYQKMPLIYHKMEDLLAKEKMTNYFVKTMPLSNLHFKVPQFNLIFEVSKQQQTITFSENYSAAYNSCLSLTDKLLFAKPDLHLFLEDLALRISVEELRSIFFDVIQSVIESANKEQFVWLHDVDTIYKYIYGMAKTKHADRLYSKLMVFNASLLRTSLRLFGDSALLTDYYFLDTVEELSNQPILPEFDQIFRTYLDGDHPINLQGLKTKKFSSLKTMGRKLNETIKNDEERKRIKKMLEESDLEYNYRKREIPFFESVEKTDPEVIIEKYVIMTHLISYDFRNYLLNGINPFDITIFKDVIQKKFPNCESVLQKFLEINQKYKATLHKTQNFFVKKIKCHQDGGRLAYKTLRQQEEIMTFRMQKGELDFTIGVLNRIKQQTLIANLIQMQMQKIIKRKMAKGIPQNDVLIHLNNISKGMYTKANLEALLLLISEANAELKLVKLPSYYKSTFPAIRGKIISELENTYKKIIGFLQSNHYLTLEEPNSEKKEKLKFFMTTQNVPLKIFEKLMKNQTKQSTREKEHEEEEDEENFDKPFNEYMNTEEKKIYSIVYGPEGVPNPEIPEDLELKTPEELEALGFTAVESLDLETTNEGAVIGGDISDEKREKIEKLLKNLTVKK